MRLRFGRAQDMPFNVQASSPKYHIASAMVTNGNFEMQFRHYQGQQNDVVDRTRNYADAVAKLECHVGQGNGRGQGFLPF